MPFISKRNTCLFYILIFSAVSLVSNPAHCEDVKVDPVSSLSLKDSINIAYLNNKDIQIQEEEIEVAKSYILSAQGSFLPTVNLDASYEYNGAAFQISSAVASGSKKDIGIFTGYPNDNRLALSIDENIYSGGKKIANLNQTRLQLKAQYEALRARKLDVEFDVKRLYYGLLLAYESSRIAQNLFDQAEAHYEDVKNKFEQGTSSKFDMLQSKVQVTKIMPELVKTRNSIDLIKADFKKLLNINMKDDVVLKDAYLSYSLIEIDEDGFLKKAYSDNPWMIMKLLGIDINKWLIEYARGGYGPKIDANFDYYYRANNLDNMFNYKHSNWSAGAVVSVPVFDGFATKAKIDEAQAKYKQAILQKENIVDQIAVDVKKGCLDLKESKAVINSQKSGIEEAKEALKISNISYDNGVGTNLDVLDAQVSLSQIEENLVEAIYDYLMARAFLDRTLGRSFLKEEVNEKKD